MKALSVRSPWWWCILHGGKDVENRDWSTGYRGRVLIHASKWYVHQDVVDDLWGISRIAPDLRFPDDKHPYEFLKPLCGHIVGSVEIVDCVQDMQSPWFFGKYGFVLRDPRPAAVPIPFKGQPGFFDVPEAIIGGSL